MKHTIVICEEIIRLSDFPSDNLSFVQDNKINPELFNEDALLEFCQFYLKDKSVFKYLSCLKKIPTEIINELFNRNNSLAKNLVSLENCPEDILKAKVLEDLIHPDQMSVLAMKKIKDFLFLNDILKEDISPYLKNAILCNENCFEDTYLKIVDNIVKKDFNILASIIHHKFATPEVYDKIVRLASFCRTDISKKMNLKDETIEYIISTDSEESSSNQIAKANLLKNKSVPLKYKIELVNDIEKHKLDKPFLNIKSEIDEFKRKALL